MPNNDGLRTRLTTDAGEIEDDVKQELLDYEAPEKAFRDMFTRNISTSDGGTIKFTHRKQTMTAQEIAEGETPEYQHTDFRQTSVDVKEYAIHTGVTRIMIEDSRLDEVANATLEARRAMERKFNELVLDELRNGWYDGNNDAFTSDDEVPDYGQNTFTASHDHVKDASSSNNTLELTNISEAMQLVTEHGYQPDTMVINSAHLQDIRDMADFENSSGHPSDIRDEIVRAGAIGSVYGLDVIVNDWAHENELIVVDRSESPLAWVERRPLTIEEGDSGFGIVDSYYSWRGNTKVLLPGAGARLNI